MTAATPTVTPALLLVLLWEASWCWGAAFELLPQENGICEARPPQAARDVMAYVDDNDGSLSPGEVVGNGYVLQELLQGLGVTAMEEAGDYYIQDFAFHIPGAIDKTRHQQQQGMLEGRAGGGGVGGEASAAASRPAASATTTGAPAPTFVPVEPVWSSPPEEHHPPQDEDDLPEGRLLDFALPLDGSSGEQQSLREYVKDRYRERYKLGRRFEGGGHGEIWRAFKILEDGHTLSEDRFVMKRMLVEGKMDIWRCGLREVYYGRKLQGQPHIARYVEHFYRNTSQSGVELWIVYHDEGLSLRKYLYTPTRADGVILYEPSEFWRRMRLSGAGSEVLRVLLRQIFQGVAVLHDRNITHRDLKVGTHL